MDKYTVVVILTALGFFALAAALLVPIWRFLDSEEKRARRWTSETPGGRGGESESPPNYVDDGTEDTASGVHDHQRHEGF